MGMVGRSPQRGVVEPAARHGRTERVGGTVDYGQTRHVDRPLLTAALQRGSATAQECSLALDRGAEFQIFEEAVPAANLATIYRLRADHVCARGLENGGFGEAVAALEDRASGEIRLGQVSDVVEQRHYQLFLAPETAEVVGCLWVGKED